MFEYCLLYFRDRAICIALLCRLLCEVWCEWLDRSECREGARSFLFSLSLWDSTSASSLSSSFLDSLDPLPEDSRWRTGFTSPLKLNMNFNSAINSSLNDTWKRNHNILVFIWGKIVFGMCMISKCWEISILNLQKLILKSTSTYH